MNLQHIFRPNAIAVIGASQRPGAVGTVLFKNLLEGHFTGAVYPVNPKHRQVQGQKCYPNVRSLPEAPDLAIIATPARTVPGLVEECGKAGIKGVLILSGGFAETGKAGQKLQENIRQLGRQYEMRILGPNSLGFIHTSLGLNASFTSQKALSGHIAFISQSGAMCTSILDWANNQSVGFSTFVSVGDMLDIGFDDLIDYFGMDPQTSSILIYMESLLEARQFMSAARAFSRTKPILVLKAGKSQEGARAALSHTGAIAGNDAAFQAAFKRAGIVRVNTISQLFNCAQALAMQLRPEGNSLVMVTNAGGPAILATDYLVQNEGKLARLQRSTVLELNKVLPPAWSRGNPVDLLGDATPERYRAALKTCLADKNVDAVLVIFAPQGISTAVEIAQVVVEVAEEAYKPIFACWLGEKEVLEGREMLEKGRVPGYRYPESAVDVFLHMWRYNRNLQLLHETPSEIPRQFTPNKAAVQALIEKALAEKRSSLSELEGKAMLAAYEIPVPESFLATSETAAVQNARKMGFPVAMKVEFNGSAHKTEFGGVRLPIKTAGETAQAFRDLLEAARVHRPDLVVRGVIVERYVEKKYELLIGSKRDPIFGPIILFGMGGIAVEVFNDMNVGLPPLNMALAMRLIEETKIYHLLKGYRGMEGVNVEAIQYLLYKFAYLVMDFPELAEIEINPFGIDKEGGVVLDAKVGIAPVDPAKRRQPYGHLVISPYPGQYTRKVRLKNGLTATLRPIRPEDEPLEAEMFTLLSKESVYFRFFGYVPKVTHGFLTRFTHIDYDREMAIIAEIEEKGKPQMAGVVRLVGDAWNVSAEYAIVVADPWHGQGLGSKMTDFILEIAKDRGIKKVFANVLNSNKDMLRIFEKRGFTVKPFDFDSYFVELDLETYIPPRQEGFTGWLRSWI